MPKAPPRFDDIKLELRTLWDEMRIRPNWTSAIDRRARKIIGYREKYEEVSASTGVPWWMIGAIHSMESGLNFSRHLHNGDSLKRRTWRVPRGRPRYGRPPFTWEESATDAIRQKGWHKITDWSIERILYETERYNGFGYRMYRGVRSPYLWSGSQWYSRGKYVKDGVWSRTAVSGQTGAACLMHRILELADLAQVPAPTVEPPLPERKPVIAEPEPEPVSAQDDSPDPVPKAAEADEIEPVTQAARKSKTIFGALIALFGAIVQFFEDIAQILIDAAAQVTAWGPAKATLSSLGANVGSIAFGITVAAIVLVISRRLQAAKDGKVG